MFGLFDSGWSLSPPPEMYETKIYSGYQSLANLIPSKDNSKERTMFQEVKNDVSTFIKEHRGVIYFVALALLVDHFIFKGVFKARLQGMLESLIGKVEAKVAAS